MPYTSAEPPKTKSVARDSARNKATKWFRRLSLWAAAALTLLGLAIFAVIAWLLIGFATIGGFTWEVTSAGINRAAGVTQIVLTITAGAGAAVALVVTYRRQRRTEDGHFLERLGSAAGCPSRSVPWSRSG